MTNRDVCNSLAAEMGGYNGEYNLVAAGYELALDLTDLVEMDAEADAASILILRGHCDLPLFS